MWEIFAYQNSDSLFGTLNAIAAMAGSATFGGALALVGFCGFTAALFAYAFAPQKLQGWMWLASVVLVMSVLFVPKVRVAIIDKTGGSAVKIVDNVPFGLAVLGSLTSTVGNSMTELYETAMQVLPGLANLPAELSYQQNGLMFGNRLIKQAGKVVFQDPYIRVDVINFINNCTMYDLSDGTLSPAAFSSSGNIWPLMGTPNPARFTTLSDAAGGVNVATCPAAYQTLSNRMPADISRIQNSLAFTLNPTLPGAAAAAVIAGQIQQAYIKSRIADASASAADLIRQNALINAVNDTSLMVGQRINDPASMMLAVGRAQATAQTNASWINSGIVAEQALPVIRNAVEAITYGLFPLFVLLLLLTSGKETMTAFKNYAAVLIWIQLWPPLYAILNYMSLIFASSELSAASNVGTGLNALSLSTSSAIYSTAISGQAVVGYMSISIPFIAWSALKRMENFGSAIVSGLSSLQATTAAATGAATTGNVHMGNVSMDQMGISPVRSSPFFSSRQQDASGNTYNTNAVSGLTAMKALANEGPASHVVEAKVTQQHVLAASKSVAAAQSESVAANDEKAAALTDVLMKANTSARNRSDSTGSGTSSSEQIGERVGNLVQIAKNVAASTGATEQQVASVAFGGSAYFGVGLPKVVAAVGPIDAGGQVSARAGKDYSASIAQQNQKINSALSSEDKAKFKQFSDSVSRNTNLVNSIINDHKSGDELAARLSGTVSRSERAETSLRTQQQFSESVSGAFARGEGISKDLAKDPHNIELFEKLLQHENGGSAAEKIKLESHFGNQATTPNIPHNPNLPASFSDVNQTFAETKDRTLYNPDIIVEHQMNKSQVSKKNLAGSKNDDTSDNVKNRLRQEIHNEGMVIEDKAKTRTDDFDRTLKIETKDGHLNSSESLLGSAMKQAGDDPDVVAKKLKEMSNSASDVVKKLLDK